MCVVWLNWFFFKFITELVSISFPIIGTNKHHQRSIFWPTVVRFYEVDLIGLKIKIKKLGLSSPISIPQLDQNFKQIKTSIYLASCPITWTSLNSNYSASNLLNVQLSIYQVFIKEKVQLSIQQPYIIHKKIMFIHGEWNNFHIFYKLVYT